jgi:hypothetical protein
MGVMEATVRRAQEASALWRMFKAGVLTREQYNAAYDALPPPGVPRSDVG